MQKGIMLVLSLLLLFVAACNGTLEVGIERPTSLTEAATSSTPATVLPAPIGTLLFIPTLTPLPTWTPMVLAPTAVPSLPPSPTPLPTRTLRVPTPTDTPSLTPSPTLLAPIPIGIPPSWRKLPLSLPSQASATQVAVSGLHIWVTDQLGGGLHSADGGATWSPAGLPTDIRWIELSPNFASNRTVFAAGAEAVYRSTDGGATWQPPIVPGLSTGYTSISISGDGTVFASGSDSCEVYRSADGGSTWTALRILESGCSLTRVVASPTYATDGVLYVLINDRMLWRSRNRGETWEQITSDAQNDLAIDPSAPSTLYVVGAGGTVWRSDNYGDNWIGPLLPAFATAVAVAPDGTVVTGTRGGRVQRSTDRGATWVQISTFSGDPICDLAATDAVIYALTATELLGGYYPGAPVPATPTPSPATP